MSLLEVIFLINWEKKLVKAAGLENENVAGPRRNGGIGKGFDSVELRVCCVTKRDFRIRVIFPYRYLNRNCDLNFESLASSL